MSNHTDDLILAALVVPIPAKLDVRKCWQITHWNATDAKRFTDLSCQRLLSSWRQASPLAGTISLVMQASLVNRFNQWFEQLTFEFGRVLRAIGNVAKHFGCEIVLGLGHAEKRDLVSNNRELI